MLRTVNRQSSVPDRSGSVPMTLSDFERRDPKNPVSPTDLHTIADTVWPSLTKFPRGRGLFVKDQTSPRLMGWTPARPNSRGTPVVRTLFDIESPIPVLRGQSCHCISHKYVARFVSDSWVSCFAIISQRRVDLSCSSAQRGYQVTTENHHHHHHHLGVLSRVTSTTTDFQSVLHCAYFSNSIDDICISMLLQTLSRYFNLYLPVAQIPSILPVRQIILKPCFLITCLKNPSCVTIYYFH